MYFLSRDLNKIKEYCTQWSIDLFRKGQYQFNFPMLIVNLPLNDTPFIVVELQVDLNCTISCISKYFILIYKSINSVFYSMQQPQPPPPTTGKKLPDDQQQNKTELFESVIAKYFEIIKTILPRISTLYLENEEFQRNLFTLQSKMTKIEKDHQNLHYQMRANHLSIDNKLNHILADYSNISNEYSRIKQQNDDLCKEIKQIKHIQANQKQVIQQKYQEVGVSQFKKEKNKKITFLETYSQDHQESKYQQKNKKSLRFMNRKSSIELDDDEGELEQSQQGTNQNIKLSDSRSVIEHDSIQSMNNPKGQSQKSMDFTQRNQTIAMKSQKVVRRKTNLKTTAKVSGQKQHKCDKEGSLAKSQHVFTSKQDEFDSTDKYKQILRQIQDFYKKNQSMKKNYEYLMGEYCRTNEQKYAKIEQQIKDLRTKIAEIDILHTHFQKVRIQLENKINNTHRETQLKISTKVDAKQFHDFVEETNKRLTTVHEQRKKVANKEETRKAVEFLQKKLNYIIDEVLPNNEEKYPKLHLIDLEISHITSRVKALPVSRQKSSFHLNMGDKTAKNSDHSTRHATVQAFTSKRQAESVHHKVRSDKMINQEQSESCYLNKTLQGNSSWRSKKINERDNLAYLRDRSRELLSRGDKNKQRTKLKKQRMVFEYD